ncbi:Uncharacterised protein [Salmonella enterica subsp. enterica serovar Typhi]|nr:Uncharacterised protein [Salmonella enterica subsp. enterica serovar Typhi]
MHLINRDRRIKLIGFLSFFAWRHFLRQSANHRRRFRTHLRLKSIGIGFNAQITVRIKQLEFIQLSIMRAGDKQLPNTALFAQTHRVATPIPIVELPDNRNATGIRRPDGETGAGDAIHRIGVRAQRFIRTQVGAFRQ